MHLSNNQYKQKLHLSLQLIPMVSYTSHEEPITIVLPKVIAAVCRLDAKQADNVCNVRVEGITVFTGCCLIAKNN